MRTQQRIDTETAATLVLRAIEQLTVGGEYAKRREIAEWTGLTIGNVQKALDYIRDRAAETEGVMYISQLGPNGGVALTSDVDRAEVYCRMQARIAATRMRRIHTGTIRQMVASASPMQKHAALAIEINAKRLIEDMERFSVAAV